MSSSMLSPTNPAYRLDPPKGGILLNAIRPHQSIPKSPSTSYTTPSSPSSSDSASGSEDPVAKTQSRRITFAPLPNPRAQDDIPVIVLDNTSGKLYENPEAAASSSGDDNPAVILPDPTTRSPLLSAKKASTWSHSTKKLLKPFYKPLQKSDTTDAGGALGLFRSSSKDSTASSVGTLTDSGTTLGRRMSTGSFPFDIGRNAPDRSGLALHPVTSENGGVASGTRMLNGRVYGASRYRSAVQRKEADKEPEFVEWGYGGMGSNRGASASSAYAAVQSSQTNVVAAEDEDDGSGMGWVRRRREAREREKREREEREAKEQVDAPATEGTTATTAQGNEATSPADEALSASPIQDDASLPPLPGAVSPPAETPEHITQAVRIPSGHHHHHPHAKPSSSRRSSDMASGMSTPLAKQNNDSTPTVTSLPHSTVPPVGSSLRMSATAEQVQSSEDSESDEESTEKEDEAREEDDDEEEEESEDDANLRKTSVCAGVEKISRHKE